MSESSFGSAAPKNRSINVGANLLGEWIEEQARLRQEIGRYAAIISASLLVATVAVPVLWRKSGEEAAHAAKLRAAIAALDDQLKLSGAARKEAQPAQVVEAMGKRTKDSFDSFVDQMNRVLSSGNSRTALTSLRCDVQAAEIHTVVMAEAEEDGAADSFARNMSEEGAKVDAITSSRPSLVLGPQGLSFLYEKRVEVIK